MNQSVLTIDSKKTPGRRWRAVIVAVVAVISILAGALWWYFQPQAAEFGRRAEKSLRLSRFEVALASAEQAIRLGEDTPTMRLIAGEAALRLKDDASALRHLEYIEDDAGAAGLAARISSASIMIHRHHVGLAEEQLRRALVISPEDEKAHRLLSDALGLQGRRWESRTHLLHTVQAGDINLQTLCYLADTDRTVELSEEQLASFIESDRPECWLGAACVAVSYREFERAEGLIRRCLAAAPELVEAHVRLGKQLLSRNDSSVMKEWDTNLPEDAEEFPDVWFVRSQWCVQENLYDQAAACLGRALTISLDHSAANHQMAHILTVLGRSDEAEPFGERGRKLTRLATLANEIYMGDTRSAPLRESAEIVESLGRTPEAMGWAVAGQYENPTETWPQEMQQRIRSRPAQDRKPMSVLRSLRIANELAETDWSPPMPVSTAASDSTGNSASATFRDATLNAGIDFLYENAEDPETAGRLMFEYTGGGVGVLDYDRDGQPDLYFTQAGALPPAHGQTDATDALYRNRHGQTFVDSAIVAGVQDFGFGQGVAAGDINNDGFPDLYVANIDGNRLYLNQGDGTFEDITTLSGVGHLLWTTSVAIADLDSDSVPDLYDVTFLSDNDVFDRICEEEGIPRSCAPAGFTAADDFVFQGLGDGSFSDVSDSAGVRVPDGDGLGILIADFAATGTPSIFIANDGRANFYFTRDMTSPNRLVFSERAFTQGLAFDRDGRAQACMGIASSDFDGDGHWDLFVTNFFNESNTLYSQFAGEVFGDNSQSAGIREPSLEMLGFGTQAIDGELDGWEDLLVANGHVDDFEYKNIPYRMPLEYYRNTGDAGFSKATAAQSGEVLDQSMLGRSMAVIDWNGDGRAEVAVSRLDNPALLLENTTSATGRFLAVQVVGTQSARDATTARLIATVNGRQIVRQFTAGDGYQSSNQKQVVFGLGQADVVESLEVQWPNGKQQMFQHITADQTIVLREGDTNVWPLSN